MIKAYVQTKHLRTDGTYDSFGTFEVEIKVTAVPRKGQTQSGYGRNLPTQYVIRFNDKWHRVKCICFSNSGTLFIGKRYTNECNVRIDHE